VQGRVISLAEAMPILWNRLRRNRRVPEARMMLEIGWPVVGDVVAGRIESVVITLLSGGIEIGRWRGRRRVNHWLRMRATSQCKWQR